MNQLAEQLPRVMGVRKVFRLRWRFEFLHKPTRVGMWDLCGESPAEQAAFVNRTGLRWAVVEGESVVDHELTRIVEVPGHLYQNFQWIGAVRCPGGGLGLRNTATIRPTNVGLAVKTQDEIITVHCDGQVFVEPLSAADRALVLGNV